MTDKPIIIDGIKFTENFDIICQTCTRNNPCFQQCNQVYKEIIKYLFNNLQRKTAECEELQAKYKWYDHYKNSALSNKELCDKKSDEIKLLHYKLQIATGVLKEIYDQADEIFSDGFRASLFCKQVRSLSLQALEQLGSEE